MQPDPLDPIKARAYNQYTTIHEYHHKRRTGNNQIRERWINRRRKREMERNVYLLPTSASQQPLQTDPRRAGEEAARQWRIAQAPMHTAPAACNTHTARRRAAASPWRTPLAGSSSPLPRLNTPELQLWRGEREKKPRNFTQLQNTKQTTSLILITLASLFSRVVTLS